MTSSSMMAARGIVESDARPGSPFTAQACTVQVVPSTVAHVASSDGSLIEPALNDDDRPQDFPGWRFSKIAPTCSGAK
jgi:hypothetical protein